jgi:peptidyl-prolyl cis-trans isomerase D
MLQWLRKASSSWLIAAAIGAIVVVFIFWGVGSYRAGQSQVAAEVNGTPIPINVFARKYNELVKEYQQRAGGELTSEMIKAMHLKEMALSQLVEKVLLVQAGYRLGLQVSNVELRRHIESMPYFKQNGKFDQKRYFWVLSRVHITPQEFEAQERQRILIRKVIEEVTSMAKVSDAELREFYRMARDEVAVNYLEVSPESFMARENPNDAAVARYYQENKAEFDLPNRVRVGYLLFQTKNYLSQVHLTPAEVQDYLEEHREEFSRPRVIRVRQILLTLPPKATAADRQRVAAKVEKLLGKLKEGEDFASLAMTYSQDAATKEKGGELDEVQRGQHPPEWDKVAFGLKPGTVGVATTDQGFYLIKLEGVKKTELIADAAKKAEQRLKDERARQLAQAAAQQAREGLFQGSLAQVAKKLGVKPQETPLFGLSDAIPGLGGVQPAFNRAALHLKPQKVSRVVEVRQGFAILKGVEFQAAHLPPLAQIKDQVKMALKKHLAKRRAEQEATRLLAELRHGKPLTQVAAQAKLTVKDSGFFTIPKGFQGQRQAEVLTSAAFQLSRQHPYPEKPLWWQGKFYLLAFKSRRQPGSQEFQKDLAQLRAQYLNQKQQLMFASWLDGERRRAKIQVFVKP